MAQASSCMTAVMRKAAPKPHFAIMNPPNAAEPDQENTKSESKLFHRARALCSQAACVRPCLALDSLRHHCIMNHSASHSHRLE